MTEVSPTSTDIPESNGHAMIGNGDAKIKIEGHVNPSYETDGNDNASESEKNERNLASNEKWHDISLGDTLDRGVKTDDVDKNEEQKKEPEKVKRVGLRTLFRYATCLDYTLMTVGSIGGTICGASTAINLIFFAQALNTIITHDVSPDMSNSSSYSNVTTNDTVQADYDKDTIVDAMIIIITWSLILGVVTVITGYIMMTCWSIVAERQVRAIRSHCFNTVTMMAVSWFDQHQILEINTNLSHNMGEIYMGIGDKVGLLLSCISASIAGFCVALVSSWKILVILLSIFPFVIVIVMISSKAVKKFSIIENEKLAKAGAVAEQAIGSIRTVASYGGEKVEQKKYDDQVTQVYEVCISKSLRQCFARAWFAPVFYTVLGIAFWYSNILVYEGEIQGGDVFGALFGAMTGVIQLLQLLPNVNYVNAATAAGKTIFDLIDMEPGEESTRDKRDLEKGSKIEKLSGRVKFDNVHFSYPSRPDVKILNGLTLEVPENSTVALVGESGCGKSTILQLLQQFYPPASGTILVDDKDTSEMALHWFRSQFGVVSQEPILFSLSIADNVRLGLKDASQEQIEQALKDANAYDFISKLPQGMNTLVGERGTQLSAGQKQRIAIARAVIRNPKILILDEATSALDNESEVIVQKALDKARQGRTTIVVAHRLSTIRNADVIVGLHKGKVAEMGTHDELMKAQGIYHTLVMNNEMGNLDDSTTEFTEIGENQDIIANGRKISNGSQHSRRLSTKRHSSIPGATKVLVDEKQTWTDQDELDMEEKLYKPSVWEIVQLNRPELKLMIGGSILAFFNGGFFPVWLLIFAAEIENFGRPAETYDEIMSQAYVLTGLLVTIHRQAT